VEKRTNMNIGTALNESCTDVDAGVDLNRNYGYSWGTGDLDRIECQKEYEAYPGKGPFSEPETHAMRDFLISKKDELKFVFNFHSFGNMVVMPINAEPGNALR
jgi:carboxypeptidase T